MRSRIFTGLARFFGQFRPGADIENSFPAATDLETVIPRAQHSISRQQIQPNALKVLYRLHQAGYQSYLVGGGVRDLLLGQKPKDFDITTNATPEQIQHLFTHCRLVGRRFRLAHVLFGRDRVEVATFRAHHTTPNEHTAQQNEQGRLLRDNVYGTLEEDAQRRDFTINSLYYSVADFTVRDYTGGLKDLQRGVIRLIGDAESRYREDPVRMLRAVRFAAKLRMQISECSAAPIGRLAPLLLEIPAARLFEESLKLLQSGYGYSTYQLLEHYQLFTPLFPSMAGALKGPYGDQLKQMLQQALQSCDHRLAIGKTVNPAFLFAALLWYPLLTQVEQQPVSTEVNQNTVFMQESSKILATQCRILAIPRRFTIAMREMWQLQRRFLRCQTPARAQKLRLHPKFRAAYDLLLLRAEIEGGPLIPLAAWWQAFQQQHPQPIQSPLRRDRDHSVKRPRLRRPRTPPQSLMIRSYLALGSNLADPVQQAQQALIALGQLPHCQFIACSRFYRSPPFGPPYDQADYLNAVIALDTTLSPLRLLEALQAIETQQGRRRTTQRWGPRTLDLDLLLYGNQQRQTPQLTLPHPGLKERPFVLYPLAEIAPTLILPDGTPLSQLLQQISDGSLTIY